MAIQLDLEVARLSARPLHRPAPAGHAGPAHRQTGALPGTEQGNGPAAFQTILREQLGVQFSQHAQQRLATRSIKLDGQQLSRLQSAVGTLAEKGGRTSLVMLDDVAMIVSVPNRTVITVVPAAEQALFTNIDSAIQV